jgi:hypothetical protein
MTFNLYADYKFMLGETYEEYFQNFLQLSIGPSAVHVSEKN